jgi:hypothetical protein
MKDMRSLAREIAQYIWANDDWSIKEYWNEYDVKLWINRNNGVTEVTVESVCPIDDDGPMITMMSEGFRKELEDELNYLLR